MDLREADLRLYRSLHHHARRRKNHLCAGSRCLIDRSTHACRRIAVRPSQGLKLRAEASGDVVSPELMLVRPAGGLRILLIDKGHRQLPVRALLHQALKEGTVLLEDIRGFHEPDILRLLQEFMPDLIEVRIDFLRRDMLEALRAIDAKIDEEGITTGDIEMSAALSKKALRKAEEICLYIIAHLRRPWLLHGQSEDLTELLIGPLFRKADTIDAAHLKEIDELEVDAVRLVIGMLW